MLEMRGDPYFAEEPLNGRPPLAFMLKDLDRHPALEPEVPAEEHDSHAPTAKLLLDCVAAREDRAEQTQEGGMGGRGKHTGASENGKHGNQAK